MKQFTVFLSIAILLTLVSGIRRGVEQSAYPIATRGPSQNTQYTFPRIDGGGFPVMWWRNVPGQEPGSVQISYVIRSFNGFVVDAIFWYGISWFLYRIATAAGVIRRKPGSRGKT